MGNTQQPYELHFAPLQGYTDAIFRNAFEKHFGGIDVYYTPFVRVESDNKFRMRDMRDLEQPNNSVPCLIPQILPGSPDEFHLLMKLLLEKGHTSADINMGCPFPLIAGKKKGSGILPYPELVGKLLETINEYPQIRFSLKIRLGWENTSECLDLLDIINSVRLSHVTVHARVGKQQYKGTPDMEAFGRFYENCKHPLFYNGDLKTVDECKHVLTEFPLLRGVSVGRGLVSSPFVAKDFRNNTTSSESEQVSLLSGFHQTLFSAYSERLQGETQLLTKMKTLWEYFLPETDRKLLKRIKKTNKLAEYTSTVNTIFLR